LLRNIKENLFLKREIKIFWTYRKENNMSHFLTGVIIPRDKAQVAESIVSELLAPYNENVQVEEYDTKCSCVGWKAVQESNKATEDKFGKWDDLRKEFWDEVNSRFGIRSTYDEKCTKEISEEIDKMWEDKTKDRIAWGNQNLLSNPLHDKPDENCPDCEGTGLVKTEYNPDSKWDWWVIGGRWNGEIRAERRSSKDGFNFEDEFHTLEENVTSVEDYLSQIEKKNTDVPFAIVTPNGEWHEEGSMGYWGIVSNENKKWEEEAIDILKEYSNKNFAIVGCDLHI
jgi:hypothetical protein